MKEVSAGFFSLTELEDPQGFLEWHQMDHMPEQQRVAGLVWGERFVATDGCVAVEVACRGDLAGARHLQLYLFENPERSFEEFVRLGDDLAAQGRMWTDGVTPRLRTLMDVVERRASVSCGIDRHVVPYRPGTGIYFWLWDADVGDAAIGQDRLDDLLEMDGVVGAWRFRRRVRAQRRTTSVPEQALVVFLDGDVVEIASDLSMEVEGNRGWGDPVLARPFLSLRPPPRSWLSPAGRRPGP